LPIGVTVPAVHSQFNLEDREFQSILHMENPGDVDLNALRELVGRRNEAHSVWGFKLPMALNSLPVLEQELRNPRFVFVFRDIAAISSREVVAVGMEAIYAMRRALVWQERMVDFVESSGSPCVLLSYEKALQFPDVVLDVLTSWCGLTVTPEQRDAARATIE